MTGSKQEVEKVVSELVSAYGYKPLPPLFGATYHNLYRNNIPDFLHEKGGVTHYQMLQAM